MWMSENVTSLVVPEGDGGGGGGGRSLPNLIRHLGEFIRCALHRNGSPRPHPQPLPRAVYIARQKEAIFSDADQPQNIFVITLFIIKNTIIIIIIIIIIRNFSLYSLTWTSRQWRIQKLHLKNVFLTVELFSMIAEIFCNIPWQWRVTFHKISFGSSSLSSGISRSSPSPITGIWVSFIYIDAFNFSCCNLYIVVRGRLGLFALVNMTFGHSSDCFVFPMFDCGRGESGTCPSVPANVASLSPARLTDHCYPPTSSSSQKSAINITIAVSTPRSWYDVHINYWSLANWGFSFCHLPYF